MNKRTEVLVVDADPQLGPLTARWLARRGARVTLVASVGEALARGGRFDALLVDDSCGALDARALGALRALAPRFVASGRRVPGVALRLAKPHPFDRLADLVLGAPRRERARAPVTRGSARRSRVARALPRLARPRGAHRTR